MPNPNPTVSIIIPNYNHARYLGDAINSVLNQEYTDFEIIVVDDGSTDDSRKVVATFGDRVHSVWQENQGLSAARNTGIRRARGEFVGVLDADDMYEPAFMSVLVPVLQSDPSAGAVFCGYQFVDGNNKPLPQKEARDIPPHLLHQALVDGNFLVPESILVRKRCYDQVGLFDTALRALEDLDMWLRITKQYKVLGTTRLLTRHRILPNSMSADPARQMQNRLAVIQKHFGPRPTGEEDWTAPQRRAYGQAYLASCVEHLQSHKEDQAYECFREMAFAQPLLLTQLNTYYELGCGAQPKGYRGDFATLNMHASTDSLLTLLNVFFQENRASREYQNLARGAYAQAYHALGLLNYGAGNLPNARRCFFHAVRFNPAFLVNRAFIVTFAKTFAGVGVVNWVRGMKRSRQARKALRKPGDR